MIQAWSCLISRLMTRSEVTCDDITIYVKIFLRLVHDFEKLAFPENKQYLWANRENFLSLLNFPDQIRQFGSLRFIGKDLMKGLYIQ